MEVLFQLQLRLGNRKEKNRLIFFMKFLFSPSGEVTIIVTGKNYSIPNFEIPFNNLINTNWTVGPFDVSFNQTNVVAIQSLSNKFLLLFKNRILLYLANASCVFPFAYNGMNYTTCITTGYGFPWCSATPIFTGRIVDCRNGML